MGSRLFLISSCLMFICSFFGQDDVQVNIDRLDSIFVNHFEKLNKEELPSISNQFINFISQIDSTSNQNYSNKGDLLLAKQNLYKSDLGLSFHSNYLDNQLSNVFDLEENISYKRRVLTSLQWDLLNNGLIENRNKAKALEYNLKIDEYQLKNESNKSLYLKRFNQTIVVFNKQKTHIINERKSILNQLYDIEEKLYFDKQINKDELLEIQLRSAEVDGLNQVYGAYNELSSLDANAYSNSYNSIPVFDLNYELLLKDFEGDNIDSISQFFKEESIVLNQWYNKVGLSLFTRHNYYQVATNNEILNRSFLSLGLNLNVPLNFNSSKQKSFQNAEINYKINQLNNDKLLYQEELLNDLYEFRYKLKQYISFYYKQQKIRDLIRIEEVKRKLNVVNFSPIKGLKYIDEFLQVELELVDLKQNLYLKLLRIQDKVPIISLESLVVPFDFKQVSQIEKSIDKSIYVWSSIFKAYDTDFLAEYVNYNNFKHVILSVNENDLNQNSKTIFVNDLLKSNVQISLMIGQNNLIFEKDISSKLDKAISGYHLAQIKSIHLDVEPHTFDNWKTEKDKLLADYLKMLNEVSIFCKANQLKLEVSIPLYYPEEVTTSILNLVDQVYFMCYENIDLNYFERKLTPYNDLKEKFTIALRTEDFKGRNEMEEYIQHLIEKLGVNKIAYHDLKRLLSMDEEELKK